MNAEENMIPFMKGLKRRNRGEKEFQQAVHEVATDIIPFIKKHPKYQNALLLERLSEPDRVISFRVCWVDDQGNIRANRGHRVQNNNAIGPYKGGLRFHSSVNLSILKFLAFEQTFKNSLTGLPMGGAKGGSDFNPKGKSNAEVMRFCQSFVTELGRYIGPDIDVPAGDIGVGAREIGYMFGQLKRLTNKFSGTLTGKGLEYGGSLIRKEATGYGAVYMLDDMLKHHKQSIEGKRILISGSSNVAIYAAEKAIHLGGKMITLSDSSGYIYDKEGINAEKLALVKDLKVNRRGRISEYLNTYDAEFVADQRPWHLKADIAIPCATQNEISEDDAKALIKNGCIALVEGANMPTVKEGIEIFQDNKVLFAPSKAANAGGVAVSGLEMSQNSARLSWSEAELQQYLKKIMHDIHEKCVTHGTEKEYVNYSKGANIGGFLKVADAMLDQGVV